MKFIHVLFAKICKIPKIGDWFKEWSYERNINAVVRHNSKFTKSERAEELKQVYKEKIGYDLNLDNPKSYTEKMQWIKLYGTTEIMGKLTDKVEVRKWIEEKIGKEYLIPLLGVYEKVEDIPFDTLPNEFVIKTNNGSATNIIVKNKAKLNVKWAKRRLKFWLKTPFSMMTWFEMHYSYIQPKVLIEQFMHDEETNDLRDYKFLCFNGTPYYCWVDFDRYTSHSRKVFDMNWNLQNWNQYNYKENNKEVDKPKTFEEMKRIVTILSKGFSHVRVDLYEINGKVYFGEMTFTNASGLEKIDPYEMDLYMGSLWNLPELH